MLSIFGRKFHRKRFRFFSIPRGFRRAPSNFARSFGRNFGWKIASDFFASFGISGAIAWQVGWKIYSIITRNARNHAKVFGSNFKIPCFAFERHVWPRNKKAKLYCLYIIAKAKRFRV